MNEKINIKRLREISGRQQRMQVLPSGVSKGYWEYLNKDISFFGNGLPDKEKESFYFELATMLKAGVDIRSALELIQIESKKKKVKNLYQSILNDVVSGATLSQSLDATKKFTPHEYYTIQIGEETGRLYEVLKELSIFYHKRIKQRRQIVGALAYPAMVLFVSLGAIIFMVSYVVPMFSDIFRRSGDDLPFITKMVISLSEFAKHYGSLLFFLAALVILFCFWQRNEIWMKKLSANVILHIPVWGKLIQKINLAQYCYTMSLLITSDVSILQAIQLAMKITKLYPYKIALQAIQDDVEMGVSLSDALSKHKIFPSKMIAMIKVGEEVNQMGPFFLQLAEQFSSEVEYQSTLLSKFIEPIIIIVLGLIVGVILIAMYLPLFEMGQHF